MSSHRVQPDDHALLVELRDVHKSFDGLEVLAGVDLTISRGETFVLLGASGSGKTVLLKIVCGLVRADRGEVRVAGVQLGQLSEEALADVWRRMGILFQAGALFDSMTVYENVALPLKERTHLGRDEIRERVREVLSLVGLAEVEDYATAELSGGMRKRVAFARAIVLEPEILLIDEPTAGLDPLTTRFVSDELVLAKDELKITTFAISHDLATAFRVADRIGLLHEGRIVGAAPPAEFARNRHPAIEKFLHTYLEQAGEAMVDHSKTTVLFP